MPAARTFCVLALLLSACSPCQPTPAVKHWTPSEEWQIGQEMKKLPDKSMLLAAMREYTRLRCQLDAIVCEKR
jgi:hypothetical protein